MVLGRQECVQAETHSLRAVHMQKKTLDTQCWSKFAATPGLCDLCPPPTRRRRGGRRRVMQGTIRHGTVLGNLVVFEGCNTYPHGDEGTQI